MGNFYNNPSVDFSLQNNEVYVRGKMFMVGKTMFGLIVSERSLQNLEEHFTKFANSFVLNEMQPAAHESMQPEQVLPQSLPNSSPQQQ